MRMCRYYKHGVGCTHPKYNPKDDPQKMCAWDTNNDCEISEFPEPHKKMVKIKVRRGLKVAIDYLTSFAPISLVPDELQKRAGLDIMSSTLAHSLRRAARDGKVAVEYKPDSRGVMIAHYTAIINDKPKGFDI